MKKFIVLMMIATTAFFTGCEGPEGPQGPQGITVEAEVFELLSVDFEADNNGEYSIYEILDPQILASDVLLIYRMTGTIDSNTPIWQPLPRTLFLDEGELDYDYDFSQEDFTIYAGGTYDLSTTPEYINNQTFRIVVIPGRFSRTTSQVDLSDYNAVARAYNIEEKDVVRIN
ncbi:MAG TPA: hypothetical protein VGB44_03155 [Flavobacterium sp.]|jgi:hypothetical protein